MRNLVCRIAFRSAYFAAIFLVMRPCGVVFAQASTSSSQENSTAKNQADTSQPAAAAQPAPQPVDQFQQLLDRAIDITSKRYLTANAHSPWQIFHYILAMRQEGVLKLGKEKVNAIEWLSTTEPQFDNQPWLLLTPHGAKFHPYTKKYFFEGHPAQFLALLSHSNLPLNHQFHVQGKVVTLTDLINNTMKEVNTAEEVTWVLWALQHFLKSDAVWVNHANEQWSIERLVQIESAAPVVGAPCGGNHRLFALTRARDKYLQSGGTLRGVWFQADQKIRQHIEIARSLQNSDGSFSADWYKGPQFTNDVNNRFNTTGHTMEFLAASLPKERLNEPWVRNAVWMLSRELVIHQNTQIDCGPLFHSLDALILYRDRIRPKALMAAVPTPKPPEAVNTQPTIATSPNEKLKTDSYKVQESPKSSVPEMKAPSKLPEVAQVPADAKPSELKSSDIKVPELKPSDVKPSESIPRPVPIPVPEPMPLRDSKTPEVKLETLNPAELQSVPQSSNPTVSGNPAAGVQEPKNSVIPKIDPSKLASIGQVATAGKLAESKAESSKTVARNPVSTGAPALLPDLAATPLGANVSPANCSGSQSNRGPLPLPDSTASATREPLPASAPADEDQEPCDAEKVIASQNDEPASALDPANP